MKRVLKKQNKYILMSTLLIAVANMLRFKGSFMFYGEPKAPESLLK